MTSGAHAAAGAAIGAIVGAPVLAFTLGVVSHVVLDVVPHYDLPDYRVDVVLTILVAGAVAALSGWHTGVIWGAVGGFAPDLENLLFKMGWIRERQRIFPTHVGPLPHGRSLAPIHGIWQLAIIVAALWHVTR